MRALAPARPIDLLALVALALALRLAMAWTIPLAAGGPDPNCAPDERAHFTFVRALAAGRAPTWPDETDSIYGAFLPTPYLLHAALLAAGRDAVGPGRFAPAEPWARGYQAARLGSALLGALACAALALAAGTWTSSRGASLVVGAAAALYPQFVFLGAYTNADAFTLCAGALHAWAVARWATRGEGAPGLAAVGATAGLVLVGKMSGYFLLPPTAAWLTWAAVARRAPARALGAALLASAAVAVPVLSWNAVRNGGDVLGLGRYHRFLAEVFGGHDGRSEPRAWELFRWYLTHSAFGTFRNMDVHLPGRFFAVAWGLFAAGVAVGLARLARADRPTRRGAAWLALTVATNLALVAYNCFFVDFSPQGRYVLLSVLLLAGVAIWAPVAPLSRIGGARLRWVWPAACLAFLTASAIQAEVLVYRTACRPPAAAAILPARPPGRPAGQRVISSAGEPP
ncbi:MAG TPA: glycosyltransferase family 39 protein [Anaeromyxobacteraceae bacterium]|nr:glycosyltransferase family 39 protein [Anaeromyxobacteraceae bacterium]